MNRDLIAAAIQLNSKSDKAANLDAADRLVREAAAQGAECVVLPELFSMLAPFPEMVAAAEPVTGPTANRFRRLAQELGIMLAAGSICEASGLAGRAYNTSLLFDSHGQTIATYRKLHLFQVNLTGQVVIDESRHFDAGREVSVAATSFGNIAQCICYDLRFPELFRAFADRDADITLAPSAFTKVTGQDHWQTLVRARAIENQMFVIAPNQVGKHNEEFTSYGHSLIVDPWGDILAEANGLDEQVIVAELKYDRLHQVRDRLPALKHRRLKKLSG